jgi:hypothetical protein
MALYRMYRANVYRMDIIARANYKGGGSVMWASRRSSGALVDVIGWGVVTLCAKLP